MQSEAPRSPAQLLAGLWVALGPGDVLAEAAGEDPPPGLKQQLYLPIVLLFEGQMKHMWWGQVPEGSQERCSPSVLGHQDLCSPAPGWWWVGAPGA